MALAFLATGARLVIFLNVVIVAVTPGFNRLPVVAQRRAALYMVRVRALGIVAMVSAEPAAGLITAPGTAMNELNNEARNRHPLRARLARNPYRDPGAPGITA